MLRAPEVTFPYLLLVTLVFQQVCLSIGRLAYLAMAKVLFAGGAKVCALAKAVIEKRAAAALYGANWKSRNFFGVVLQQVGIGRSRKWRVNFATMKKTVDLIARALTLLAEDSSDNENGAADGVGLSGLVSAPTVHYDVVTNSNEDEPNVSIECEPRILNETTGRDREEEIDLEIDETTDVQEEIAGSSNGQKSADSSSCTCHGVQWQDTDGVVEDSRTHPRYSAKLLWEDDMFMTERKPIHYYRMSFPTQMLPDIITWSATAMPSKKKKMDEVEFWNLLGIIYALTCVTKRRRDLWSTVDGIFPAPKFGSRFSISRGRFEEVLNYLRFCPPEEFSDANYKWAHVCRLTEAFNKR